MDALVFPDQASALAAEAHITSRGRELFIANGFQVDGSAHVIGKRASDNADDPGAQTTTCWDIPRQRLDGKWIISDPVNAPEAGDLVSPGVTVRDYVLQDLAGLLIEAYSTSWFQAPLT